MTGIIHLKRIPAVLLVMISLIFAMAPPISSRAAETEVSASSTVTPNEIENIYDNASLLDAEERNQLDSLCETVNQDNNINVIIITADSINGNRKQYLEDFYDSHNTQITDAVLLLLNMDNADRGVEIQGYGQCEYSISDDRIELILDDMMDSLKDGRYYEALNLFVTNVDTYMQQEPTTDYQHTSADNDRYNEANGSDSGNSFFEQTAMNLLIALVIGLITVLIMAYRSSGRNTTNQNTYLDFNHSRILGQWDRYLRSTTTKTRKPQENNSSGGSSGGGVSSGGSSHSGGGRSF